MAVFQYLTVAVFIFLIAGFWKLQVQNPDVYSEAAERNRIKSTPILAARGKILDRDGRVIVDNKASYSLLAEPRPDQVGTPAAPSPMP